MPDLQTVEYVKEPMVKATIIAPIEYTGPIKALCSESRGTEISADAIEGCNSSRLILANLNEPPDNHYIISRKNAFGFKLLSTHALFVCDYINSHRL